MPTISIITPTRREDAYLPASLDSVRDARREGAEHLVVDGAASDQTARLVAEHGPTIRYVRLDQPDSAADRPTSPAAAVNRGFELATGEIIGWLNADDRYAPGAVGKIRDYFTVHPDVDVVYGGVRYLAEDGSELQTVHSKPWNLRRARRRCYLSSPSVFFRRRIMERVGRLNTALAFWEEYDLWLRMLRAGARFAPLTDVLGDRRTRSDGRRLGNPCPLRQAAVAREFCEIQAQQLKRVAPDLILEYATLQSLAEDGAGDVEGPIGRRIVQHALLADQKWNRSIATRRTAARARFTALYSCRELLGFLKSTLGSARSQSRSLRKSAWMRHQKLFSLRQQAPQPLQLPVRYSRSTPLSNAPRISIVTPNFNQADFLGDTIRSVLDQEYPHLEYIVQDGASTDGSVEVIRQFEDRLAHWESRPDSGQAQAINWGMQRTSGEILAYLNSDDLLLPGSLAYVARYFQRNPRVDVVYGHRLLIDADGRQIGRWILPPHDGRAIHWADYIPQETMFWRRRAWERVGGQLDESFQFALDWDLILRFQAAGLRFRRLPRFLGAFRVTEQQKTSQAIRTVGQVEMNRLRRRALGFEPAQEHIGRALRPYLRRHRWHEAMYSLGVVRY